MNQCLPTPSFYTMRKLHSQSFFCRVSKASLRHNYPKINIANKRPATHNCLKKFKFPNLSSMNIFRMLLTVFPYRFPSPPLSLSFGDFGSPPAWTAASGLAIVNSESFCIKRPPSWSRVSMVDWVPCKCLDFWVKFSLCCWFWSDWCEEYEKKPGITVTKTWGKGWGLEIKDQRQKNVSTNAKLLVSLGWWFAILGVP